MSSAPPPKRSRGLGDTIAKVTRATGIDAVVKAVEKVTGADCGCDGRQEWLNSVVPYAQGGPVKPGEPVIVTPPRQRLVLSSVNVPNDPLRPYGTQSTEPCSPCVSPVLSPITRKVVSLPSGAECAPCASAHVPSSQSFACSELCRDQQYGNPIAYVYGPFSAGPYAGTAMQVGTLGGSCNTYYEKDPDEEYVEGLGPVVITLHQGGPAGGGLTVGYVIARFRWSLAGFGPWDATAEYRGTWNYDVDDPQGLPVCLGAVTLELYDTYTVSGAPADEFGWPAMVDIRPILAKPKAAALPTFPDPDPDASECQPCVKPQEPPLP